MGYAVLHLEKAKGADSKMSAHIERTSHPKNADETRTHLNRELVQFPEGVNNRTEAIAKRIESADIKRKIADNQVRAIRVLLTGTNEDMKRMEADGTLGNWCDDNLKWLRETFGKENVVSAVLHMDEQTPHLHATVIPIVTGERRKAKQEQQNGKKKYRKKNSQAARLCVDDVMTQKKLKHFQDTYAETMNKYGLQRGVDGSEARHISTNQYYRDLLNQTEDIQEDITLLLKQREETERELSKIKSKAKTEKLKNTATETMTAITSGVGSLFGSGKLKELERANEELHQKISLRNGEIENMKVKIQHMQEQHSKQIHNLKGLHNQELEAKDREISRLNTLLEKAFKWFPVFKEMLRMEKLCAIIGFTKDMIDSLLTKKEAIRCNGKIYSEEHRRKFEIKNDIFKVERNPTDDSKLVLTINRQPIGEWFKEQFDKLQQGLRKATEEPRKSRGFKL